MKIDKISSFGMNENCYLITDENGEGFLIDPGSSADEILYLAEKNKAKVTHILLTHCHYDHIIGLNDLRRKIENVKVIATKECSDNLSDVDMNLSAKFGNKITSAPADTIISDGEVFKIGELSVKAIKTPGHTSGGVCYLVENNLFSGDTLFLQSVGRWDFAGGDFEALKNSIQKKLYILPDETKVYPGHGDPTTIGYEKENNCVIRKI